MRQFRTRQVPPQLVFSMKPAYWVAGAAIIVIVAATTAWWLLRPDSEGLTFDEAIAVRPYTPQDDTDPVELNEVEVRREAPALAQALDEARTQGRGYVESKDMDAVWTYLYTVRGAESRSALVVEYLGETYLIIGMAS